MNKKELEFLEDIDEDTIGLLGSRFARIAARPRGGVPHKGNRSGYSEMLGKQHWVRPRLS